LAEIKDQTKRWFEVLIWTLLLWDHAKRGRGLTGKLVGTPKAIFNVVGPIAHFDHVPAALQDYWLVRFINPSTGRPFFHDPPRVVRPGHPVQPGPVANLAGYMSNIADAAERDKVALVARGPLVAKEKD